MLCNILAIRYAGVIITMLLNMCDICCCFFFICRVSEYARTVYTHTHTHIPSAFESVSRAFIYRALKSLASHNYIYICFLFFLVCFLFDLLFLFSQTFNSCVTILRVDCDYRHTKIHTHTHNEFICWFRVCFVYYAACFMPL